MTMETLQPQQLQQFGKGERLIDRYGEFDVSRVTRAVVVEVAAGDAGGCGGGFGGAEERVVEAVGEGSAERVECLGGCDLDDASGSDFFVGVDSSIGIEWNNMGGVM